MELVSKTYVQYGDDQEIIAEATVSFGEQPQLETVTMHGADDPQASTDQLAHQMNADGITIAADTILALYYQETEAVA